MNLRKTLSTLAFAGVMTIITPVMAMATPHFTIVPASGNETVGVGFTVLMGIDSDTEKVVGVDIKANFDSSKLEVVSIEKGIIPDDGYQFSYTAGQAIIHNDTGMFEVTLTPLNSSVLVGPIAKHQLLKVTFKPKAVGTATFSYVCQASSLTETNIINGSGADVVDCGTNQSGSYVIAAASSGGGATDTPAPTAVPTSGGSGSTTVTTPTKAASTSSLPKTGGVSDTIALLIVGMSSIGAAVYFKYL